MSETTPRILGMRDQYFQALLPIFLEDKSCVIITADNGAPTFDEFVHRVPDQVINVGIAEQMMMGMAAGLAFEGHRVWTYCIAPFATTRVHEFVKLDVCAMNLPITILGVGAGYAYDIMGPSHHTVEDISIMRCLPNLEIWSPADSVCAASLARHVYERKRPAYIRFDRSGIPNLYDLGTSKAAGGYGSLDPFIGSICAVAHRDPKLRIISTGIMVHQALKVAESLKARNVGAEVYDFYRLKPFTFDCDWFSSWPLVTLEEHFLAGGLGSMVAEAMADAGEKNRLLRLGRTEKQDFCMNYGGRENIWKEMGLDVESVVRRILEWL